VHVKVFGREVFGRIIGGMRVLELAADSREATLGNEGRSLDVDQRSRGRACPLMGVEFDTNNEEDSRGERSGKVMRR
jgi:hypothetical protein